MMQEAVWYQTELMDAGMPMPALVSSMPMPGKQIMKGKNERREAEKKQSMKYRWGKDQMEKMRRKD